MHNETTLLEYRINRDGDKFVAFDSENEVVELSTQRTRPSGTLSEQS
jgi:hypothetical protein